MHERTGLAGASTVWRGSVLLVIAGLAAACSGASGPPATSAPASVAATTSLAVVETTSPPPASSPPASASTAPSGVPILNPEHCPPTTPAGLYKTADGTQIDGDQAFIAHIETALALLKKQAPTAYADVLTNVVVIRQVESFSGMCYDTGTYRVGEETAYAPGHPLARQIIWLGGTIVHDGCHRARFVAGLSPSGRDAELDCLQHQVKALDTIKDGTYFRDYVQNLIDTVDDPDSQYWTNPDRHW